MQVKIQLLDSRAIIPRYSYATDAGMDLVAITKQYVAHDQYIAHDRIKYGTGIALEIPNDHVGLIFPRSSIYKTSLLLSNSVGVIDSGYRGEIIFYFNRINGIKEYEIGDRVGQIIILPYPHIDFVQVNDLTDSDRGENGYGSSGR